MKNKKFLFILAAVAILAAVLIIVTQFQKPKESSENVIKIGAILPLTGSAAEFGVGNKNGITLMIEDINNSGGIDGKKISVSYEDSQNDPKTAASIFNKMIVSNKPDVLFICMSSISMSLKPLIESKRIPAFCVAATPELTKDAKYIFRLLPTINQYANALATLIKEKALENERIAVFYINDEFGESFKTSFLGKASKIKLNVVYESSFDKEGSDFRSIIVKALDKNPNSISIGGYGSALGVFIKQLREKGFKGIIYGTPDLGYPRVLDIIGNIIGECYIVDFAIDYSNPRVKNFIDRYKNHYGTAPSPDAFIGYDGMGLIAEGYKNFKLYNLNELREGIIMIKKYPGIMGELTVDETGDVEFSLKLKKL